MEKHPTLKVGCYQRWGVTPRRAITRSFCLAERFYIGQYERLYIGQDERGSLSIAPLTYRVLKAMLMSRSSISPRI